MSPFAQGVKIKNATSDPDPSAILDIESSDLGVLLPRLTTQERDAIVSPANGLIIFNTDCQVLNLYTTVGWRTVGSATVSTIADAGTDQLDTSSPVLLNGNSPGNDTGQWIVVSGSGGSIDDTSLPSATFTGTPGMSYILQWTIEGDCGSSSDQVSVSISAVPVPQNGLIAWFDADDTSTFTLSGNSIIQWDDKSSSHLPMTSGATSERPTLVQGAYNGRQAVRFDGGDYLQNALGFDLKNRTIFVVVRQSALGSFPGFLSVRPISGDDYNSNSGYLMGAGNNSWLVGSVNNETAYNINLSNDTQPPLSLYCDWVNNGSGTFFKNGIAGGTDTNSGAATSGGNMALGARYSGFIKRLNGDICEVIIYNYQLSPSDRQIVEEYLRTKWNLW